MPKVPYLKGVGKYEGVVIHYTDSPGDNARMEADFVKTNWKNAFVHEFIDATKSYRSPIRITRRGEPGQKPTTDSTTWSCAMSIRAVISRLHTKNLSEEPPNISLSTNSE